MIFFLTDTHMQMTWINHFLIIPMHKRSMNAFWDQSVCVPTSNAILLNLIQKHHTRLRIDHMSR